eukprot:CAMPEP_0183331072 /NCGR_PEP_ID=MMETSP0164_2-20130417/483_1 /TAXON_ID=221442 /ORGANISM="Coccolithus pelagicus ssp braarudi, Strain PLY182g" /LENGTH=147 /DNA_ID=CAMNT_0025499437 /DNA_START=304 /DNA_END=748 /DNA_ORIENTATION=-
MSSETFVIIAVIVAVIAAAFTAASLAAADTAAALAAVIGVAVAPAVALAVAPVVIPAVVAAVAAAVAASVVAAVAAVIAGAAGALSCRTAAVQSAARLGLATLGWLGWAAARPFKRPLILVGATESRARSFGRLPRDADEVDAVSVA